MIALLAACRGPRPVPPEDAQTIVEGRSVTFRATIPPGAWYTVNFVPTFRRDDRFDVAADYTAADRTPLTSIAFTHPRSEVTTRAGLLGPVHVDFACTGLGTHPLKIAPAPRAAAGTLTTRGAELGLFGFGFRNDAAHPVDLRVTIRAIHGGAVFAFVGTVPADAIDVPPPTATEASRG